MTVEHAPEAMERLYALSSLIVSGAQLEETLEQVFDSFHDLIPYDRIGYAEVAGERVTARWARSNAPVMLRIGYSAPLAGSSLSIVLDRRQPRVLNDLPAYLESRPGSRSTMLMVHEGIKSSMTCPLFHGNLPIGFLFFSSRQYDTYTDEHVRLMKQIAMHLALLVMASDRKPERIEPSCRKTPKEGTCEELFLSQLKPGMYLAESVRVGNGTLLLRSGTRLTSESIDRLVLLHQSGFADLSRVAVSQGEEYVGSSASLQG